MWISELSERSGLPVDTIKHYLRVGVLPRGEPVGPQRAEYDESHVKRLTMIRAMHDVGQLSLDRIREIFDRIDSADGSVPEAVAAVHQLLSSDLADYTEPSAGAQKVVDSFLDSRGWEIEAGNTHRRALAVAVETLTATLTSDYYRATRPTASLLGLYADHLEQIARVELAMVDQGTAEEMLDSIAVGTVLLEPVLMLVRRISHQQLARAEQATKATP